MIRRFGLVFGTQRELDRTIRREKEMHSTLIKNMIYNPALLREVLAAEWGVSLKYITLEDEHVLLKAVQRGLLVFCQRIRERQHELA